ncbi:MAG: hypothetical protein Faunusvirus14_9 [Faunusvirus sp.]|jgi:hypothetical protein|uniref:Uncharacterized protein n=1 Tax=Faunusvirus sp. TaxID=2487766 RepID=A0A3G4ZWZ8_9VIRU|nr:MAG: hypothetical protein Faunusvirus14_9 [Faunusvirus sp.]
MCESDIKPMHDLKLVKKHSDELELGEYIEITELGLKRKFWREDIIFSIVTQTEFIDRFMSYKFDIDDHATIYWQKYNMSSDEYSGEYDMMPDVYSGEYNTVTNGHINTYQVVFYSRNETHNITGRQLRSVGNYNARIRLLASEKYNELKLTDDELINGINEVKKSGLEYIAAVQQHIDAKTKLVKWVTPATADWDVDERYDTLAKCYGVLQLNHKNPELISSAESDLELPVKPSQEMHKAFLERFNPDRKINNFSDGVKPFTKISTLGCGEYKGLFSQTTRHDGKQIYIKFDLVHDFTKIEQCFRFKHVEYSDDFKPIVYYAEYTEYLKGCQFKYRAAFCMNIYDFHCTILDCKNKTCNETMCLRCYGGDVYSEEGRKQFNILDEIYSPEMEDMKFAGVFKCIQW